MMIYTLFLTVLVVVFLSSHVSIITAEESSSSSTEEERSDDDDTNHSNHINTENHTCGLYIAISSTSTVDDTNWGLFVGQDMDGIHQPIGHPEIGIVVSNLRIHNDGLLQTRSSRV